MFYLRAAAGAAVKLQNNVLLRTDPPVLYLQWHRGFYDLDMVSLSLHNESETRSWIAVFVGSHSNHFLK